MKVYVASSWRNEVAQQVVVHTLRAAGHEVYDFRNPPGGTGFSWSSVALNWREWSPAEYRTALQHPTAVAGFASDMNALRDCDACVLVAPCGSSAHMELGYAVGAGRLTVALLAEGREAELMLGMVDALCLNMDEVLTALEGKASLHSTAHVSGRCEVLVSAPVSHGFLADEKRLRGGPEACPLTCSECAGGEHHWLEASPNPDDPDDEDLKHEAYVSGLMAWFTCKHCDAWRDYTEEDGE